MCPRSLRFAKEHTNTLVCSFTLCMHVETVVYFCLFCFVCRHVPLQLCRVDGAFGTAKVLFDVVVAGELDLTLFGTKTQPQHKKQRIMISQRIASAASTNASPTPHAHQSKSNANVVANPDLKMQMRMHMHMHMHMQMPMPMSMPMPMPMPM